MDIDEAAQRKIERFYDREESRRVLAAEIGDIDSPREPSSSTPRRSPISSTST